MHATALSISLTVTAYAESYAKWTILA